MASVEVLTRVVRICSGWDLAEPVMVKESEDCYRLVALSGDLFFPTAFFHKQPDPRLRLFVLVAD